MIVRVTLQIPVDDQAARASCAKNTSDAKVAKEFLSVDIRNTV